MTPDVLTQLLYQEKVLHQGRVLEVHTAENAAFNSQIQHLKVRYSSDAVPPLPTELVLKKNVPTDWGKEAGQAEVVFYRFIAQQKHRFPMIIPHVVATYDEQTGDSLLLLQDLSATHHPPVARRLTAQQVVLEEDMPASATLHQIVETLATFHAAWWEHPQLGTPPLEIDSDFVDEEHFRQRQENRREETMLRRYLAVLQMHGVTHYTWDQLMEDYRLMIMFFLQVAIWDQTNGSVRDYWWPKLQRLLSAARDLDCVSLLR